MAAKIKGPAGESRRALTVVLVFFILSTIGAGLAAYYGNAEMDKHDKKVKEAERLKKVADEERDYTRTQLAVLQAYLGMPAAPDSPVGRELGKKAEIEAGSKSYEAYKDLPDVKAMFAKLNARSPWDNAKGAPRETYEALIKALQAELAAKQKEVVKANEEVLVAQAQRTSTQTDRTKDQDAFNKAVEKVKKEFEEERQANSKRVTDLENLLKNIENKKDETIVQPLLAELDKVKKDREALNQRVKDLDSKILALSQAAATTSAGDGIGQGKLTDLTVRGKITRVHINPRKLTIDLGRVHGLTPQTTFAVHGFQPNGKPRIRSKANIEVIDVGETTSEALVTEVFHPDPSTDLITTGKRKTIDVLKDNTDPIIAGDALINPAWNPNSKTHIVIAGLIDLHGTGAISLPSLVQVLERQNIIVDAYVDPLDGAIKGKGVSRRTDFVLLGADATDRTAGGPKDPETIKTMNANIEKLKNDAKLVAVPLKQAHVFFRETGFNLPRNVATD
jgi:hypothetical protein